MKKTVLYLLLVAVIGLLGYQSIYFRKLSEVKNTANKKFDPYSFSKKLWEEGMASKIDQAIALPVLINAIQEDKEAAFSKYTHALAIGNYRYTFVQTEAIVREIREDDIQVQIPASDSLINSIIATEYIYGNVIRDASGLVQLKDFSNTADLNTVSEEMNKIVKTSVVPELKRGLTVNDTVRLTAAIELNKEHVNWQGIELIPVKIQKKK